jgi:hypothetical protein
MTSEALAIVAECNRLGFRLTMKAGGTIHINPKPGADLMDRLRRNKAAILAILTARESSRQTTEHSAASPSGDDLPVTFKLTDLDKRILLACGHLPTPSPSELPPAWHHHYRDLANKLIAIGVHPEHAEGSAFIDTLERMLACDELLPEGW